MTEDFATIAAKRLEIIEAGFSGDENIVRAALSHASGDVRSSALSSLHRLHVLSATELGAHVVDVSEIVRRNVAQIAADFVGVDVARGQCVVTHTKLHALGREVRHHAAELSAFVVFGAI